MYTPVRAERDFASSIEDRLGLEEQTLPPLQVLLSALFSIVPL
jgi:hypothetical protein